MILNIYIPGITTKTRLTSRSNRQLPVNPNQTPHATMEYTGNLSSNLSSDETISNVDILSAGYTGKSS
jgi:hypothetical protein